MVTSAPLGEISSNGSSRDAEVKVSVAIPNSELDNKDIELPKNLP